MTLPFVPPQLASPVAAPPTGDLWLHELKLDGYRMQLHLFDGGVALFTRNGLDWTARFSQIADSIKLSVVRSPVSDTTIMDGELIALDSDGKSNFSALQEHSSQPKADKAIVFFAFDLLCIDGVSLLQHSLIERKSKLNHLVKGLANEKLQYLDHVLKSSADLLDQVRSRGLEGIVSKRLDRPYKSGRSADWLKFKLRHRERFVIGGYEVNESNPNYLSSLLVGYFDGSAFEFAGRVGTGITESMSKRLLQQLAKNSSTGSPFTGPVQKSSRYGSVHRHTHWVLPKQVIEVAFAGWTNSSNLRQASFITLVEGSPKAVSKRAVLADSNATLKSKSTSAAGTTTRNLLRITNPGKVLFENGSLTKEQVLRHTVQVAQWILPHLQGRPTSLVVCPNGVGGAHHFRKHPQKGFPAQLGRFTYGDNELLTIDNIDALMAMIQISAIEFHPWGCRVDRTDRPDRMVIDLDPDTSVTWTAVIDAANMLRHALNDRNLASWVKTTGGKGLHLVVPLVRRHSWDQMFAFAKDFAEHCTARWPTVFVATMSKRARKNRIFIDYHRNRQGATSVGAYSLRARAIAAISTPVAWSELSEITSSEHFTIHNLAARLRTLKEDPWEGMAQVRQSL